MGLIVGLTACCKFGFSPLHVIGESAMIIRQQLTRTPPKAKHLQPLYWKCRRLHAGTRVLSWQHHLRAYNKMADGLANMAMDTKKSMQTLLDHTEAGAVEYSGEQRWGRHRALDIEPYGRGLGESHSGCSLGSEHSPDLRLLGCSLGAAVERFRGDLRDGHRKSLAIRVK
jgi:hypothetical protein